MVRFFAIPLLIQLTYGCSTCDIFGTCKECPEGQKKQSRGEYDVCVSDGRSGESEKQPIAPSEEDVACYIYDSNGLLDAVSGYCENQPKIISLLFSANIPDETEKFQGRYFSVNTESGAYSSALGHSCYFETLDCSGTCLVGLNTELDQFSGNGESGDILSGTYFDGQNFHVFFQQTDPVLWEHPLDKIQSYYANGACASVDRLPEQVFIPAGTAEIKFWPLKPPFKFDYGEQ